MELLLVEVVHFLGRYYLVIVKVYHLKPVVKWLDGAFVFFAKHKVNKIFVAHFTWLVGLELSRHLVENTVDCFATQSVSFVAAEVFLVYYKIMVRVKFPKPTVEYIKVLVAKELPNFVNVVFFSYCMQNIE